MSWTESAEDGSDADFLTAGSRCGSLAVTLYDVCLADRATR
ncbi:hypothetical protein [Streptomyces sp. 4F14]